MADRFWGRLKFPAHLIDDEIRRALEEEGAEFDGETLIVSGSSVWEPEIRIEDNILILEDAQASYGMFEELEDLLRRKGIPFDRESGQYAEYSAKLVIFRPAKDDASTALDLTIPLWNDEPFVSVREIREIIRSNPPTKGAYECVLAIQSYLDEHYPAYPPLSDYVKGLS